MFMNALVHDCGTRNTCGCLVSYICFAKVYGIGIPLFFMYQLVYRVVVKKVDISTDFVLQKQVRCHLPLTTSFAPSGLEPLVRDQFAFLHKRYEKEFCWWELMVVFRKFGFVIIFNFISDAPVTQSVLGSMWLAIHLLRFSMRPHFV